VPTELSVVGFDDSSLALRLSPPLTTVAQDVVAKGTLAAAELVRAMRRRRAGEPERARHHLLPAELVVRESTAPP
jgi:DNA-binding LacI/PurR family transcriptional regulator